MGINATSGEHCSPVGADLGARTRRYGDRCVELAVKADGVMANAIPGTDVDIMGFVLRMLIVMASIPRLVSPARR